MGSADNGESTAAKEVMVKRKKCAGVRVVGGRVYDSENGTTCHQCRQKTRDLAAECKNMKKDRQCTMKICEKCLLNRYGEKLEKVAEQLDWHCPKCRGICNCSFCMKKKGHKPTGILAHTAKATGFSSVSAMLEVQGPDNVSRVKDYMGKLTSPKKIIIPDEGQAAVAPSKKGKENSCGTTLNYEVLPKTSEEKKHKKAIKDNAGSEQSVPPQNVPEGDAKIGHEAIPLSEENSTEVISKSTFDLDVEEKIKRKREDNSLKDGVVRHSMKHEDQSGHLDVTLPQGSQLTKVAGVDLSPEDVGNALQFLEFCATFGEIIGILKGQPECVLRDIMGGRGNRCGKYSSAVQFHIKLLSLLQEDLGEESLLSPTEGKDSWLNALKSCLSESECYLNDIVERIVKGNERYGMLDCSQKLKLLTFLCDEAICTAKVRNWIDDQSSRFDEKQKEAKEKYAVAKEKEKKVKQKLQDQVVKALNEKNGTSLTMSKHESIISKIKAEASKAHAATTEALCLVPKRKERSAAVRTESIVCDTSGSVYWRLKGYDNSLMLLQVCDSEDQVTFSEKWFSLNSEEGKVIETYLPLLRMKRRRRCKDADAPKVELADMDFDS